MNLGGGLLPSIFGDNGSTTVSQVPLETPEQRQARQMLLNYAQTGKFGDITAGEDIGINPGNYDLSGLESQGLYQVGQGLDPSNATSVNGVNFGDLLDTSEAGLNKQFSPYNALIQRQISQSVNAAKRAAGFGGTYSSDTIRNIGQVYAQGNEQAAAKLADLQNEALSRKASLLPTFANIGQQRLNNAFTYGQLPRTLANASIQDKNNELLRRRQEQLGQISGATSVINAPVQFGVPSVTTQNPNPYLQLLQSLIPAGATLAAAAI